MDSFSEYGDAIFRFCLVKVSNKELAEDMTQEVFMRYWQYLRKETEMTNTRSLLYTIANNLAKDWYKKKKSTSLDVLVDETQEPAEKDALGPEALAEYGELLEAIDALGEPDSIILTLRYLEGLPPSEIAEMLNDTANNISVRINRAEGKLKQQFQS